MLLHTVSIYFAIVSISSKAPRSPCRRRDDLLACAHCLPGSVARPKSDAGPVCYPKGPHPVAFTDRVLARAQSPNVVVVRECVDVLGGRLSGKIFCRSDLLTSQLTAMAPCVEQVSSLPQRSEVAAAVARRVLFTTLPLLVGVSPVFLCMISSRRCR